MVDNIALENKGEHGLPALRILVPKLLLIRLMFLNRPVSHLSRSDEEKEPSYNPKSQSILFTRQREKRAGSAPV